MSAEKLVTVNFEHTVILLCGLNVLEGVRFYGFLSATTEDKLRKFVRQNVTFIY